jgi:hypothetical protein
MYGQLVSDIRNYVEKAKFMGLENAESTRLLETAAGVIEFETATFERLCHPSDFAKSKSEPVCEIEIAIQGIVYKASVPMEKMWSVMPLLLDGLNVEWEKEEIE